MTLTKLDCNMCTVLYFFHRILMFEEKKKEKQKPQGVAPKRDLSSLPWRTTNSLSCEVCNFSWRFQNNRGKATKNHLSSFTESSLRVICVFQRRNFWQHLGQKLKDYGNLFIERLGMFCFCFFFYGIILLFFCFFFFEVINLIDRVRILILIFSV